MFTRVNNEDFASDPVILRVEMSTMSNDFYTTSTSCKFNECGNLLNNHGHLEINGHYHLQKGGNQKQL